MAIEIILIVVLLYLLCGFFFAIVFIIKGVDKIDEVAHKSSIGFRIIIIPGTMVFWPLLLEKWLKSSKVNHSD